MRISDWSSDVCSSDLHYELRHRERLIPLGAQRDESFLPHAIIDMEVGIALDPNCSLPSEGIPARRIVVMAKEQPRPAREASGPQDGAFWLSGIVPGTGCTRGAENGQEYVVTRNNG